MCKQYLLSEGNISKWKQVKLDNIQDFISECNSKDDISQTNITSNKNRMSREDIIRFDGWIIDLGVTDNKTFHNWIKFYFVIDKSTKFKYNIDVIFYRI